MGGVTLTDGSRGDELDVSFDACAAATEIVVAVATCTLHGGAGCVQMRGSW